MRVTRLRAGFSAALLLSGLVIGGLVTAPSASAVPTAGDFNSTNFTTWDSTVSSPMESFTGTIGSTFTVAFPAMLALCVNSIIKPTTCGDPLQMTIASSGAAVIPASGVISTASITTFTVMRSGTLTLTPVGINVACGVGCTPLTIVITAVGPKSLVSSNCTTWNASGTSNELVSGHIGETFTVTFPKLQIAAGGVGGLGVVCPSYSYTSSPTATSPAGGTISSPDATTFTITGSGTISFSRLAPTSILSLPAALTITVTALPSDAPPPDLLQQVGAPSASTCAAFIDTTLNWAGAPSGGWGTSWAQWVNQGKGGTVCTRSLYWLPTGRWGVRP